jgi:hypothetical protein
VCNTTYHKRDTYTIPNIDTRWLGWKYPNRQFNFKTFNDENIFALANVEKRSEYTKELANEINEIINKFKATIQIKTIKIATSCG